MTLRETSETVLLSDTATPGEVVYTAPTVGGALAKAVIYGSNVDPAAARTVTLEHDKGSAHGSPGLETVVLAYSLPANSLQVKLAVMFLRGHKTDPDEIQALASTAGDILLEVLIEEDS
jgi:hypothetical protein